MSGIWNQRFESWGRPLSETEDEKCANAESVISSALNASPSLATMGLRIFAQGSYRANTNIRVDSDVDICVCNPSVFFADYPAGMDRSYFGNEGASLTFSNYREKVGQALLNRFTSSGVQGGEKAFKVRANTYRIKADVVPTFGYRLYYRKDDGSYAYASGVKFVTTTGQIITNWPDHTYRNGVDKNTNTSRRFKRVVRVLKGLRNEMQEDQIAEANEIASFLIESIIWNVPDAFFRGDTTYEVVESVVNQAWYLTYAENRCANFMEVNGMKALFSSAQPWTREKTSNFLWSAMKYVGMQ